MSYILITRPHPDAQKLAEELSIGKALPTLCEPMLQVVTEKDRLTVPEDWPEVTDLIITSSRVLDIIQDWSEYVKKPIWCVGEVTAKQARKLGFEEIHQAQRSAQDLLELIVKETLPEKEKRYFLHGCGETLHLDIAAALGAFGFHARKNVLYRTKPTNAFSPEVIQSLKRGLISVIPFFSQRSAEIFVTLIRQAGLEYTCEKIHVLAHSDAVKTILQELSWASLKVVPQLSSQAIREIYQELYDTDPINKSDLSAQKSYIALTRGSFFGSLLLVFLSAVAGGSLLSPYVASQLKAPETPGSSFKEWGMLLEEHLTPLRERLKKIEGNQQEGKEFLDKTLDELEKKIQEKLMAVEEKALKEKKETLQVHVIHENIRDIRDRLLSSALSNEDIDYLRSQGWIQEKSRPLSLPELRKKLKSIDFTITEEASLVPEKSIFRAVQEALGVKIRQKKEHPVKEKLLSQLGHSWDFLDEWETLCETLPTALKNQLSTWMIQCEETHSLLQRLNAANSPFEP